MPRPSPSTPAVHGRPTLLVALIALAITTAARGQSAAPPDEAALIAVLRSEAQEAEKAITCKRLAIHGSATSVPALAPLLANERLASWARIALEAMPGPEAAAALRGAAESLSGPLAIGAINSLGVRRDPDAIGLLGRKLSDGDAAVAEAAAAALGRIGTAEAADVLAASLAAATPGAVCEARAEACVICADHMRVAGLTDRAVALADAVRGAGVSEQRQAEAERIAILAGGSAGIGRLVAALQSPMRRIAALALATARELGRGEKPEATLAAAADRALIAAVGRGRAEASSAERVIQVIGVLAERHEGGADAAVEKALTEAAATGPASIRLAAVEALGRAGSPAAAAPLLDMAAGADPALVAAIRGAVARLPGAAVDDEIRRRLAAGAAASLPLVAALAGDRRLAATAELSPLVKHGTPEVRQAALKSLGAVVDLDSLGLLLGPAVSAQDTPDRAVARAALGEASIRMPDRDACAERIAAAMADAGVEARVALLGIVGEVGGSRALAIVAAAGRAPEEPLQDAATRLLGKWMTADAAPVLLELAAAENGRFQTRAVRGAMRIARQFNLPEAERADICRRALAAAKEEADRLAILEILVRHPSVPTLRVAEEAARMPGLAEKAREAEAAIRKKLPQPSFRKRTLTERFVAEGCAAADFDRDGHVDVTAGNTIWHGPDFERQTDFTPPADNPAGITKTPYDPARGYSDFFLAYAHDFNTDTWPDILVYGVPGEAALLYVNPQGRATAWEKHAIFDVADGESPDLVDVTGDGRPELLVHSTATGRPAGVEGPWGGQLGYAEVDWSRPTGKARFRPITPRTAGNDKKYFRFTHGYGAGDVNGDGRVDILTKDGWFEQPADTAGERPWTLHPAAFGTGGAHMYAYDVNGDGRADVITSRAAHGYGLGWFEQRADGTFVEHAILPPAPTKDPGAVSFSQLHAVRLEDIDGDGLRDIVTGKRRWAHGINGDAEPNAPPVLYWFRLVRDGSGGASFEPRLVDHDSGVGTQVTVTHLDADGRPDIVVANKRGVFTFTQVPPAP